jgi:antitoxin CptB
MTHESAINQLRWSCRRGMLELDILLGGFLESGFLQLNQFDQQCFIELLSYEDQELFFWFTARETPPDHMQDIVQKIKAHAQTNT